MCFVLKRPNPKALSTKQTGGDGAYSYFSYLAMALLWYLLLPSLPHNHCVSDVVLLSFRNGKFGTNKQTEANGTNEYVCQIVLYSSADALLSLLARKMDFDSSSHTSNWLYDYGFDISIAGDDFSPATHSGSFSWVPQTFKASSDMSLEVEYSLENSNVLGNGPRKRSRSESCASGFKACREKLRRDRLNERFLELSSILEPGKPPKTDKAAILDVAVRVVTQLRNEADTLKEMNDELLVKIKESKDEKNELREEKNRLKIEKEKLELQFKVINVQPSFFPDPSAAKEQAASHKLIPFISCPGIAMWLFMSPAAVDTSQDHLLRPPVA